MAVAKHMFSHGGGGFVPAQEVFQLTRLLREKRGRWPGDIAYVFPTHGEVSQKSFREWSMKNIVTWQLESKSDPHAIIEIQSVSHAPLAALSYQVDLSVFSKGITTYFVLRITQVSQDTFTLVIQRKNSPASIPIGLDRAPVVWSKAGKIGISYL